MWPIKTTCMFAQILVFHIETPLHWARKKIPKNGASPGFEPGTTRTQSEYATTAPQSPWMFVSHLVKYFIEN